MEVLNPILDIEINILIRSGVCSVYLNTDIIAARIFLNNIISVGDPLDDTINNKDI